MTARLRPALAAVLAALCGVADHARAAEGYLASSPDLGKDEGRCRPNETGPAVIVTVEGLKDRTGNLKLELYPAQDGDFLADDNVLIMAGKTFRRVETRVPASGAVRLCLRVPGPGPFALMLLHDRDGNRKFGWRVDGVGFSANPRLGLGKPKAARARIVAGGGITPLTIVLNYQKGLGMAPLAATR
ncbi:hypothetical protein GCM10011614_32020 [Novosphingobium colocasiae]|uniref:DUF2141 domain-containing protein n=1 Tax=Novosphingobium colocasiae TaxID=1256513 RepID=A0A918UIM6_9SPHN|nr:hypothetical protein GCM10011614_32020 [Novosphingobium colocasiae]